MEVIEKEVLEEKGEIQESMMEALDERIRRALQDMGFDRLTPIQEQAIPELLKGGDIIGQAQTGTGKTAAFGIPLIQKVNPEVRKLQAVVLCPTRELAIQAALEDRFQSINDGTGIAFTLPLSSVIGKLSYGFLSNERRLVEEEI